MMMRRSAALLLMTLSSAALSPQPIRNLKRLTDVQMRQLAIAGADVTAPKWRRLRGFELDREPDHRYAGRYVVYEALWNPPMPGSAHVGFYVIDPRTGDMWDGVSECGVIASPEIRRLQRRFRNQLGLSSAEYSRIKRRGPMCDQEAE
jgi:hypothetical protein